MRIDTAAIADEYLSALSRENLCNGLNGKFDHGFINKKGRVESAFFVFADLMSII